jgi:hypothetical protein
MPDLGPNYLTSLQRFDDINIIAMNRQLCQIMGINVYYSASDVVAGTVLAQDSSKSNAYVAYASGGSNGTNVACCVLEKTVHTEDFPSTTGVAFAQGIFGGAVYYDKLVGVDANALTATNLNGRKRFGADSSNVLFFG